MNKKYKFALFDWDGCLSDTLSNAKRIFYELGKGQGVEITDKDVKEILGDWEKSASKLKYNSLEELKIDYTKLVEESITQVKLNTNAIELLTKLSDVNIPVGIVTTSSRQWIIDQAKNEGVENLFDELIGFEDVINTKPDPEPIFKMIDLLHATQEDSVMIGDTDKDILAANNARIDSIWYNSKENKEFYGKHDLEGCFPTYIVEDLIQILDFFV